MAQELSDKEQLQRLLNALEGTTSAIEREDWEDAKLHAKENRALLEEGRKRHG